MARVSSDEGPSRLYRLHPELPAMESPVLVLAPEGWIDAGTGGGAALQALVEAISPEPVATFDIDVLLDHRSRRPVAHLVDGVYDDLRWPEIELQAGHDAEGNSVLVLVGPEPDNRWLGFAHAVGELAERFSVRLCVGMGAFPAPVPHTRPIRLAATATTSELAQSVGIVPGELDVPAGVLIPVQRRLGELGIPALSLWARVPHYIGGMPYPAASVVLLEGLASVGGISIDASALKESAEAVHQRLDGLIANSMEHRSMISQLEARFDAEQPTPPAASDFTNLPSGDELAAEVERFLRDQGP